MAKEIQTVDFMEKAITETLAQDEGNEHKKSAEKVWEDNCPVSMDDVDALRQHDRNYSLAFQRAVGRKLVNDLNGNTELNYSRAHADLRGYRVGVEIARHSDPKATLEQRISGFALTTQVRVHEEAADALKELASLLK